VLIAVSIELGDDLGRAIVAQHGTAEGIEDAREIIQFEAAHGLWVEPGWQLFFQQTHHIFVLTITWFEVARVMNGVYILCHIFVTLGVGAWVYFFRRRFFPLMRNTIIVTNAIALIVYERFPVAPPRLMPPVHFDGRIFTFQDTLYGVLNGGRFVGSNLTYNEFSAMPSVHIAWALVAAAMVIWLARPLAVKLLAMVYPVLMLVAVVVTANHFLLDAIAATFVVLLAAGIAVLFECWRGRPPWREMRAPLPLFAI
jgi:hypothetical protein